MPHIEVREILDPTSGEPTGTYRLAFIDDLGVVRGLCTHSHETRDEAAMCPDAADQLGR